jgi:hypothetical protein
VAGGPEYHHLLHAKNEKNKTRLVKECRISARYRMNLTEEPLLSKGHDTSVPDPINLFAKNHLRELAKIEGGRGRGGG